MPSTRKNKMSNRMNKKNKTRKGGKRTLSPKLKAWNQKVMTVYRREKAKNKNYKLGDAMRQAKKE